MASEVLRKHSLSSTSPEHLAPENRRQSNGAISQQRSPNGALVDVQATGLDNDKPGEDPRKAAQRYSILTEVLAQKRIEVEQLRASFRRKGSPAHDISEPALVDRHKHKEISVSPPFRLESQSPVPISTQTSATRQASVSPALRIADEKAARTSLDREFSPKPSDSYTSQRLREKLRDMEKMLVKTQSDLIKEREQGWAAKAQLAMEMQGRLKSAEADLKQSKDVLEGRFRELQERNQETRVALDQERRKALALEAQIEVLTAKQSEPTRTDRSYDTDPDEKPRSARTQEEQQTSRSAPELIISSSEPDAGTQHIAELVSANATLQEDKSLLEKRVLELESDLRALLDNSKRETTADASRASEVLAEENKTLLRAQLQAQQDLQKRDAELQRLRERLTAAQDDVDGERELLRTESVSVHALLGQKTADTARLEDLLRIERLQRLEGEREQSALQASLRAEEERCHRFQEEVRRLAEEGDAGEAELLREQVADLQDELTALHLRLSAHAARELHMHIPADVQTSSPPLSSPASDAAPGAGAMGAAGAQRKVFEVDFGEGERGEGREFELGFTLRLLRDAMEEGEAEGLAEELREEVAAAAGLAEPRVAVRGVREVRGGVLVDVELSGDAEGSRDGHVGGEREREGGGGERVTAQEALGRVVQQLGERASAMRRGHVTGEAVAVEVYWPTQTGYPPHRRGEDGMQAEEEGKVGGKSQEEWVALVEEQTEQIQSQNARIMALEDAERDLRRKLGEERERVERMEVGHEGAQTDLDDARRELEGWKEAFRRLERQLDEHDGLLKTSLADTERRLQDAKSALLAAEVSAAEAERQRAAAEEGAQASARELQAAQAGEGEREAERARAQAASEQRAAALGERLEALQAEFAQYKARMAGLISSRQETEDVRESEREEQLEEERARTARLADELNESSERVQALQRRVADLTASQESERRRAEELEERERRASEQAAAQLDLERKDKEVLMRDLRQASSALEDLKAKVSELEEADANVRRMREGELAESRAELEEPLRKAELQVKTLQERLFEAEASLQRESKAAIDSGLQIKSLQVQGVSLAQTKVQLEDQLEKLTNQHEMVVMELNRIKALAAERENEIERQRGEAARREAGLEARLREQQDRFDMAYAESEKGDENVGLLAWYREELNKANEALEHRSRLVQTLETEVRSMHARAATLIEAQGLTEQFRSTAPTGLMGSVTEEREGEDGGSGGEEGLSGSLSRVRSPDSESSPLRMSPPSASSRPVSLSLSPPAHLPPQQASPGVAGGEAVGGLRHDGGLVGPALAMTTMAVPVLKPTFPSSAQLSLFASKPTYSGQLRDGWPHGRGITTWADGRVYEGEWTKGVFTGTGTCVWSNGDVYEGEWEEGFAHGFGMYTYASGDKYEGRMQQDKFHGHGAYSDASGWKYRGGWAQGKMHGWGLVVLRTGEKLRQHFHRGVPAGSPDASDQVYSQMLMAVSEVVSSVREQTGRMKHSPEVLRRIQSARDRRGDASAFSTPLSSPAGTLQQPNASPGTRPVVPALALRSPSDPGHLFARSASSSSSIARPASPAPLPQLASPPGAIPDTMQ